MNEIWYLVDSGSGEAAFNMALDEALLAFAPMLNRPVLRFYGWSQPAATFGYFQKIGAIEPLTELRPLIRRTTGGGLVPHDGDWTYSLVFPPDHEWYQRRASDSYRHLHLWWRAVWHEFGVVTELADSPRPEGHGQCFVGAETFDLLWQDRKMAGAAQRRSRHGLLIQGSIQRHPVQISRQDWQRACCDLTQRRRGVDWVPLEPSGAMLDLAIQLTEQKYKRSEYNRRR
jgi:lipoyl(octanoyl) transferase